MMDAQPVSLTVEQRAYRLGQQHDGPEGPPDEDQSQAQREPRTECDTPCRLCKRPCRARSAMEAGMRWETTRCSSGKEPVRVNLSRSAG
jgi:hypothetical protein